MFRKGDKVKAFLDPKIVGIIQEVTSKPATNWTTGGTSDVEFYALVKLGNGKLCQLKLSELMHDDF